MYLSACAILEKDATIDGAVFRTYALKNKIYVIES